MKKDLEKFDWKSLDLKHPLFIVVAVFLGLVILYFIASPYQNCVREGKRMQAAEGRHWKAGFCEKNTSW
jgi:Ni/Fe-hydrogenase subunit HybB-like protein